MMGAGTIGYCSIVIGVSSQMVATLTNGYCSIADFEYNLNVNWNDNCFKPILAMELKSSGKTLLLSH
jgi:hypothetical protein